MYEELVKRLRYCAISDNQCSECKYHGGSPDGSKMCLDVLMEDAADAIEELSKRIDRAVELYNRGVERSAMYEALVGIAPDTPKEEAPTGPYDLLYEEGGPDA